MAEGSRYEIAFFSKGRQVTEYEFQDCCTSLISSLQARDTSDNGLDGLRKVYWLIAVTRKKRRLSSELVGLLTSMLFETQQGSTQHRLLALALLKDLFPNPEITIESVDDPVDQDFLHLAFSLVFSQEDERGSATIVPLIIRWLTGVGTDHLNQARAVGCLPVIMKYYNGYLTISHIKQVSAQLASWLKNASTMSAPSPFQKQIFATSKTKGYQPVLELDGAQSRSFFTVLSLAQYHFSDQILNNFGFSILRAWLQLACSEDEPPITPIAIPMMSASRHGSPDASPLSSHLYETESNRDSPPADSISICSMSSLADYTLVQNVGENSQRDSQSPSSDQTRRESPRSVSSVHVWGSSNGSSPIQLQTCKALNTQGSVEEELNQRFSPRTPLSQNVNGEQRLKQRAYEYCIRVIEQSERKSRKPKDKDVITASLVEAVKIFDVLCSKEKTLVPKVIDLMKRLFARMSSENNREKWLRAVVPVVQFFLNHGESVVYDVEPAINLLFGSILSKHYTNQSFAFDIISFCLDNLEKLGNSPNGNMLAKFFPNLLKILAFSPRTYLHEILDLLAVMLNRQTAVEIYHTVLDLPCLSAALEASRQILTEKVADQASSHIKAREAFQNPQHKRMLQFITRTHGGHGDTIDKLDLLHSLLDDLAIHPRVLVCSQVVEPLLNKCFGMLQLAEVGTVSKYVPVILERAGQLYPVLSFQQDIRRCMAEQLLVIFKKHPEHVLHHQQDILEFLGAQKNLSPEMEDFFTHVVYIIGEYLSSTCDTKCTPQIIVQFYEVLEAVTYEISVEMKSVKMKKAVHSPRLLSVLMTALAKLSSRCQDLLPRVILCLTKVIRQELKTKFNNENYKALVTRAQELISLLKMPNVAPDILTPNKHVENGRSHMDTNLSLSFLLQTTKTLVQCKQ